MATRESNVIMFPQRIDPERKEDVRISEQFLKKIDGLIMKGLQALNLQGGRESRPSHWWRHLRA